MFYGAPKEIELGVDPARKAEAGMIEGLLMKHAGEDMQKMFTDPTASTRMVDKALSEMKQSGVAGTDGADRALPGRAEELREQSSGARASGWRARRNGSR